MKKRILALSLAAAMLVGAMASCNAKEEVVSSAVEAKDVKLVLWGSENDQAFLKEVSAEWATKYAAEHDDVKTCEVQVDIKGEDVAAGDAMNDMSAAADVFGIPSNNLGGLSAADAIYEMPSPVVDSIKEIVGGAIDSTFYNGKYYGFPYAPNTAEIMYYNKTMYTEDEVKDLGTMLAKDLGDVTNLIADINSSWNSMTWIATAGGQLFTGGDKTVNTLNKAEVTDMLVWLKEQIDAKKIVDADSAESCAGLLKDGKAAALFYGRWSAQAFADALGDNYAVCELPSLNGKHLTCFGGGKMLVVNAQSKEAEAAFDLSLYLIGEEAQLKRFETVQNTPTAYKLADNEKVKADPSVAAEVAQGAYTVNSSPLNDDSKYWDLEAAVMTSLYNGELADKDAIQAALDKLVADMNTNLGL